MLYSRIELSGPMAGIIYRGNTAKINAIMDRTNEVSQRHLEQAFEKLGAMSVAEFAAVSPVGRGNPGTLAHGGSTPPRAAGTLKRSWRYQVHRTLGADVVLEVWSTDPVSEYVDKGTGIYATGSSGRKKIRPDGKWLAVPSNQLAIGGSKSRKGKKGKKKTLDVRFLKSVDGTPARHIRERVQKTVRPFLGPMLRDAASDAKRDLKNMLRGS